MKKVLISSVLIVTLFYLTGGEPEVKSKKIIKDLGLIKGTYNYVNDKGIRWEMIRRQNMIINTKEDSILYKNHLIKRL